MSKIYLNYKQRNMFRINLKKPKRSRRGDFDIMIDVGNKMLFEEVVAGNYFSTFKNEINAISWHGFYEEKISNAVLNPVVNFKKKNGSKYSLRHFGCIDISKPIPVPICSVYVPKDIDLSLVGKSGVSRKENLVIDIDSHIGSNNVRFDFFIFPDGINVDLFKRSEASWIFHTQKIDVFNNGGNLSDPESGLSFRHYTLKEKENVLIRCVLNPIDMFTSLKGKFALVINEPNDVYNILNREACAAGENGEIVSLGNMQKLHEKRMLQK